MSNFSSLIPLVIIFGGTLISIWGIKFFIKLLRNRNGLEPEVVEKEDESFPYVKKNVMSPNELKLYGRLVSAFPDFLVLSQVQLSRALVSPAGRENGKWNNRINRMSLDFVLCDKNSNPVCAVELDDKTHLRAEAINRDAKKDKALGAAGIPIVRIKDDAMPTVAQLPKLLGIDV
jgi:hypothetical protein